MSNLPPGFVLDGEAQPAAVPRGAMDKLLGLTGERYQTWPERLVREAVTAPKRMIEAAATSQPGSRDFIENTIPAATETAMLMTPANPAIRAGDKLIPGMSGAFKAEKPAVPTTRELATAGGADINAAKNVPIDVSASAVAEQSRKIQQELFDGGIHPVDAPATFAKLKELENAPSGSIFTPANLQSFRESLNATAQNFNDKAAKDQLAASRAIKGFDQFLPNLSPKDVVARSAAESGGVPATPQQLVARALEGKRGADEAASLFERGRGNYAAAMRSNDISGSLDRAVTGILERAEGRAQAANSGRNLDNTIRQKVAAVLEKPKEVSGHSDAEMTALEGVRDGGRGRNLARALGNWMAGGGGWGQTSLAALAGGAGAAAAGWPGALVGASIPFGVGTTARSIANALARRDLSKADEMMRMRSPMYEERVANPEMAPMSAEKRAAIVRALMLQQQQR